MLIARKDANGRAVILLGLTDENLERLIDGQPISIRKETHGPAIPDGLMICIVHGHTIADLQRELREAELLTDRTRIHDYR